jgi:ABC-type glycerol-3-phosphate transport system substrate-binding protein
MFDNTTRRRISRRHFLIGSAAISTFAALAACAPAPAGEQAADTQAASDAAAPAPEPTVAIGEYGTSDARVTVWHGLGGADGATFATMLEQYANDFPEVSVRSETYDWNVFFQKFPTAVAAGTPPDWAIYHAAEVPQMASQGLMTPVDDIFFSNGEIPKDDFSSVLMDVVTYEGSVMCVPFDNHGWVEYVNTAVIEAAGLDPMQLPTNGAEFIDWALQVTTDTSGRHPGEDGFDADNVAVWAIHDSWHRFTMPSTLWQFGGGTVSEDQAQAMLDSEQSIAAIQYWHDLMHEHRVCPPVVPGRLSPYDQYETGSLAVMWDGTWSLNFFKDNPDLEPPTSYATGLFSLAPDGAQAVKMDSHIMSIPPGVSEEGMQRAAQLIKWLSDNGKTWATSGQIPARISVQQDPDVQAIWSVKAAADQFNAFGKTEIPHPAFIEIQTVWETAVSAALTNTTPLQQALQEGAQQIQAILDRP